MIYFAFFPICITFARMKLHIFNPEHDLSLAANQRQFTAPHAGRQLRSDLAFIPALWAEKGDLVLVDDIDDAQDKLRHLGADYINKVEFITKAQLKKALQDGLFVDCVHPWGWDLSIKHELERIGLPAIMLPADDVLLQQRQLSSRQWAAEHLQQDVEYVNLLSRVENIILSRGKAVVKAPWSSSGRGVRYVSASEFRQGVEHTSFCRWVENIICRQGGVTVEPYYNKVKDFGMEFEVVDGKVIYRGLSLFLTVKNAYTGNILASEKKKEEMMAPYVSPEQLQAIRQDLIEKLQPALQGVYSGSLGVDMMVYSQGENGGELYVNPCIELNLRRTMGHVALALSSENMERARVMRVEYDGNKYHLRVLPGMPSENAPFH